MVNTRYVVGFVLLLLPVLAVFVAAGDASEVVWFALQIALPYLVFGALFMVVVVYFFFWRGG